ncbi:MAG: tannase/feruloyl esterase family alpha/beta hydrolase [Acidobacteria bacterium]|nr:tannase/feruloyl esterase family alpha/beta hydrolase [Acidobacteriota bacterium]
MRIVPVLALAGAMLNAQTKPVTRCSDLRALTNLQVSIAVATDVPATAEGPAHCRVFGQILPEVGFEVRMPAEWNGRFVMLGNGGFAGEDTDSRGRQGQYARAMRRGYAVAATDTGHSAATDPGGTFAADRQKLLDYAFRSLHVTAETARMVLRAYYGAAPAKSYFDGCSTGGRQGLILAQRFPDDFDGIVVGAPVLNFTGTIVRYAQVAKALREAPITTAQLPLLAARVYAKCDAVDGIKDGIIDDPLRCDFAPARDLPRCAGTDGGADCFTAAQIRTLETIYAPVQGQGKTIFPGWPVSSEGLAANGRSGWDPWTIHDGGPSLGTFFSEGFFRYLAPAKPDPNYDILTFDIDKDLPKLETIHRILDATDTDLTRFRDRGGRIFMYFGWADPALNPMMGVEYYQAVTQRMGPGTTDFFRLFMVPGMLHCGGGPGPDQFDSLGALAAWVEQGTAPDTVRVSKTESGKVVRSRVLCAYPEVARWKGTGSTDDAANFTCVKP